MEKRSLNKILYSTFTQIFFGNSLGDPTLVFFTYSAVNTKPCCKCYCNFCGPIIKVRQDFGQKLKLRQCSIIGKLEIIFRLNLLQ